MAVNLDASDSTWITHLDGLLVILRKQPYTAEGPFAHLIGALHIVDQGDAAIPSGSQISFLILRLKTLVSSAASLLSPTTPRPRHIDVMKLQQDLKKLYADIRLAEIDTITCALTIVTANLLVDIGSFLDPGFSEAKQYAKLAQAISASVSGVHAACATSVACATIPILDALRMTWALYTATIAHGIEADQKRRLRELQWRIGEVGKVPLAFRLVSDTRSSPRDTRN